MARHKLFAGLLVCGLLANTSVLAADETTANTPPSSSEAPAVTENQEVKNGSSFSHGTVASAILFKPEDIQINPFEVILTKKPACRILGLIVNDNGDITGKAKRLVCKAGTEFIIWAINGVVSNDSQAAGSIPAKRVEEGLEVAAGTPVKINIEEVADRHTGQHVYIYDTEIGYPVLKIQLSQLLSYQEGTDGDELPELQESSDEMPELMDEESNDAASPSN